MSAALIMKCARVLFVRKNLPSINIAASGVVDVHVVRTYALERKSPVYNLTVSEASEYFANGVLVHNCDPMRYIVYKLDNSRAVSDSELDNLRTGQVSIPDDMLEWARQSGIDPKMLGQK
jgi:hypothetical protein